MAGWKVMAGIGGPVFILSIFVVTLNMLQVYGPEYLPAVLQNWDFLPMWMTPLQPFDDLIDLIRIIRMFQQKSGNLREMLSLFDLCHRVFCYLAKFWIYLY